jgi:hypothetical protein
MARIGDCVPHQMDPAQKPFSNAAKCKSSENGAGAVDANLGRTLTEPCSRKRILDRERLMAWVDDILECRLDRWGESSIKTLYETM